jgi:hypothetical protein
MVTALLAEAANANKADDVRSLTILVFILVSSWDMSGLALAFDGVDERHRKRAVTQTLTEIRAESSHVCRRGDRNSFILRAEGPDDLFRLIPTARNSDS